MKRNGDHFGVSIILGSIWGSFQGWGSFWGLYSTETKAIKNKCYYSNNCSDPGMLGFVNQLLTIPKYNKQFGCFLENLFNQGGRYSFIHSFIYFCH